MSLGWRRRGKRSAGLIHDWPSRVWVGPSSNSTGANNRAFVPRCMEATPASEARFCDGTTPATGKPSGGAGSELTGGTVPGRKTGNVAQVSKTSARSGVVSTGDGSLTITCHMRGHAHRNSVGLVGRTSSVSRTSLDLRPTPNLRPASNFTPTQPRSHPPGFPSQPPPGFALVDPSQAASQAVVYQVQAMFKRFEESFERCMAQVEARAPRECSRSPLGSSFSRLRKSDDFSSQEELVGDIDGRLVSVGSSGKT